jgi:TrmH family RNA methyltransferase
LEVFATSDVAPDLLDDLAATGAVVRAIAPEVLARAVDTVSPQGVAAVASRIEVTAEKALAVAAGGPLVLVLVDVADPGNAGTLVRAAEASGAAAVLFCGSTVDPCNPKCVRASAGALFHVPVAIGGAAVTMLESLERAGVPSVGTVVRGGRPYDAVDLTGPVAVVLGSEAHGLPEALAERLGQRLSIPMEGRSESLNVAMAGAILCFESLRQRRAAGP